jgi:hypothetical protein
MNTNTLLPYVKLQFNLNNPSYEDSYLLGFESAAAGGVEEDNPFAQGSQAAVHWLEGWWAQIDGDEPLFKPYDDDEDEFEEIAANDEFYSKSRLLYLFLEISGAIAASALVGYQLIDLVA